MDLAVDVAVVVGVTKEDPGKWPTVRCQGETERIAPSE